MPISLTILRRERRLRTSKGSIVLFERKRRKGIEKRKRKETKLRKRRAISYSDVDRREKKAIKGKRRREEID